MNRTTTKLLISILLFGIWLAPIFSVAQIKSEELATNVYLLSDDSTSVKALYIRNKEQVILVDAMFDDFAMAISKHLDEQNLTVKYVINTHYHGDHTGGNTFFKEADIVSHYNTHQNIVDSAMYGPTSPFGQEDMPNLLFSDSLTLNLENTQVHVVHFGPAHTNGDAIVILPEQNIIQVGDVILTPRSLPFSTNPKGTLTALKKVANYSNENTIIVTGHGDTASKTDLVALINIIETTIMYVENGNDLVDYPSVWNEWNSSFISMKTWLTILDRYY
ncbi:MAG: MBL fold metallo-hydrolase [Cyclobacteriaceae bacterium]